MNRIVLGVWLTIGCGVSACITEAPATPEVVSPEVDDDAGDGVAPEVEVSAGQCRIDADCPAASDACNRARCDAGRCSFAAVTCGDDNDCTEDRCDPTLGCAFDVRAAGSPCRVGDGSESCVGEVHHLADACDGEGHCRDMGSQDCGAEPAGACYRYACVITDFGGGCELAPRADGIPCSADGRSDECADGALHGADVCVAGECVDAGWARCPSAFCEAARCDPAGGCAVRDIGVERVLSGNWLMLEMFAGGTPEAPRLGTIQAGFAFGGDGTLTTYGTYSSVPQAAPGDGDYCVSSEGDLRFALPYGSVAPAPRKLYRGSVAGGDDMAVVFREAEPSLGVLMRLPVGNAPKLVGRYRVVGAFRRNVIGTRALLGSIAFDAQGCISEGEVRFSDEFDPVAVTPGDCQQIVTWLLGLRLAFGGEAYVFRGTSNHDGDTAALTIHTDQSSVGDGLVLLMRERELDIAQYDGRHTFARIDVHDERVTAARGEAIHEGEAGYTTYEEISLDGERRVGEGSVSVSSEFPGGHREESGGRFGTNRVRFGQASSIALGRVGFLADIEVPRLTSGERTAFPLGTSLRIDVVRP